MSSDISDENRTINLRKHFYVFIENLFMKWIIRKEYCESSDEPKIETIR